MNDRPSTPIIRWLTSHQGMILGGLFLLALAVFCFVKIADEVMENEWRRFDDRAIELLRDPNDLSRPIGPAWVGEAGRDLTALGGFSVTTLLVGGVTLYLLLTRNYGTMCLLLAASVGAIAISYGLKDAFARPRPELVPHLSYVKSYSFPSAHSMNASAVYLTLGAILARVAPVWRVRLLFLGMAVGVTILVGVSRVYMGVHYPTDVLAGWCAGLAWALVCLLATSYFQHRGAVETTLGRG